MLTVPSFDFFEPLSGAPVNTFHRSLRLKFFIGILLSFLSTGAHAACTSPDGGAGGITWNGTDSVIWCDGANWHSLKNVVAPGGSTGHVQFNNAGALAGDADLYWDNINKRLGIGTTTPQRKLEVAGVVRIASGDTGLTGSNNSSWLSLNADPSGFGTGASLVLRGSGSTSSTDIYSGIVRTMWIQSNGDVTITGQAYKPGGGSWVATSDVRLKDIDGAYMQGLKAIVQLQPVRFHYKKDNPRNEPSDKAFVGLVAQDVLNVFPEAVSEAEDGYLSLDSTPMSYAVINAIRELKMENDALRADVEALEKAVFP